MGTISIYVARESSSYLQLLQRLSKISNWLSLRLISNYYLCAECWSLWDIMCALSEKNLFLTNFWLSHTQALKAFKVRCSGCSSSQWNIFRLGSYYGAQTPPFLGRISAIVIVFLFVACLPRGKRSWGNVYLAFLPMSWWFLLYIFNSRRPFLLVLVFLLIVAL